MQQFLRQSGAAVRLLVLMTVVLGVLYPGAVWAAGQAFGDRAHGQILQVDGRDVGSRLLGQKFTGAAWFHSRPSAVDWDGLASAPSNLGPSNPDLVSAIEKRRTAYARENGIPASAVPPDALTTSASGLDPYISPENARLQAARVAAARGLSVDVVRRLVAQHERGRQLGFLGEPTVNVLELNLALTRATDGAH